MTRSFLLLEITDPEANALLWRMRELIAGKQRRTAIHLTVRGPYSSTPPDEILHKSRATMARDVLRIHGVGRFSNPNEEVVFLRVDSPHLRDIWWKPSFPGFEPHISIYRGADRGLASTVEKFLRTEGLDILCAEYRLTWHKSGQRNLFDSNEPTVGAMQFLYDYGRVDPEMLDRLAVAIADYRASERRRS